MTFDGDYNRGKSKMADDHQDPLPGLPVKGYKPTQPQAAIDAVNRFKELEERVLREIDFLNCDGPHPVAHGIPVDGRLLAIGRTQLQGAFMFLARAVFQPQRISLPEDAEPEELRTLDANQ